ncbi:hypothetical protein WJX79_010152 [Trebouxia sp. C0005]
MQSRNADRKAEGHAGDPKVLSHIDMENKRVKEVTDAIMYDLLPAAIACATKEIDEVPQDLTWESCQHIAGVALVVACLLNAPPSFLEFLLCVPWQHLGELYPRTDMDSTELPQITLNEADRRLMANLPLQSDYLCCVLDFIYRYTHNRKFYFMESLPVQLRLVLDLPTVNLQQADAQGTTRSAVAALLDGATPLHAAALRGNPAQIDHLLFCKADPMARTAAGDYPFELVPICADKVSGGLGRGACGCQCMGRREAEVWQCRSKLARGLIVRRCLTHFAGGFKAWAYVLMISIACMLGLWPSGSTMHRPVLQGHEQRRAQTRRSELATQARALVKRMRFEAGQGLQYLTAARQRSGSTNLDIHDHDPGDTGHLADNLFDSSCHRCRKALESLPSMWQLGKRPGIHHTRRGSKHMSLDAAKNADSAFDCFSRALKALQKLGLQGNLKSLQSFADSNVGSNLPDHSPVLVAEDEQADVYCCWAESALLKFRGCLCVGCSTTATQAIRMAYFHTARLFASLDKKRARSPDASKLVGARLARVLHAQICLLLDTQARQTATRNALVQSQLCLQEWDRMKATGLANAAGLVGSHQVVCLLDWVQAAGADLTLVEALQGSALDPNHSLATALPGIFVFDTSGRAFLSRPVVKDTAQQLETALAVADGASEYLIKVTRTAADNAAAEILAGETLQEIMAGRLEMTPGLALDTLSQAVQAAQKFPHLKADVQAGQQLMDRWAMRNEAIAQLEAVMDEVSGPVASHSSPSRDQQGPTVADHEAFWAEWALRIQTLEQGIEQARQQGISVSRAKRVLKELQAQANAAEAAAKLEALLLRKPCKASLLKAEVSKAEAASSAASGPLSGPSVGSGMLTPLIQRAKHQLEAERARAGLHKAIAAAKTGAELPQLEAAIQAARKAGVQDRLQEASRHASDLRARLDEASQAKARLQTALEALLKHSRAEDAAAVEEAMQTAQGCNASLEEDIAAAQQALQRWQRTTNNEAKLAKALREGASVAGLSRAIQEATACGVKVADAKRVLKLMQSLEAALQADPTSEAPSAYRFLKARLEAAEQGGVSACFMQPAKARLRQLLMADVKKVVESALRTRPARRAALKTGAVRDALDQAESMLESGLGSDAEPFVASAQNWRALHVRAGSVGGAAENGQVKGGEDDVMTIPDAAAVKRMLGEAYRFLEEEAEQLRRVLEENAAEAKLKREQQIKRENAVKEKAERDRAERECAEKEKSERRRKEREDRAAAAKEAQLKADQLKRDKIAKERLAHVQQGSAWRQLQPEQPSAQGSSPYGVMPQQQPPEQAVNIAALTEAQMREQQQQQHKESGPQLTQAIWTDPSAQALGGMPDINVQEAYDGYEASVSERHSDTTSDNAPSADPSTHKAQGRALTCSPSLRSSAASTDDMLSPTIAQRLNHNLNESLYAGFSGPAATHQSDMHSSFSGSAMTEQADGAGYLVEAGRLHSGLGLGHLVQDAIGSGFSAEPHQRNLSPELGTERSSSSFSSSVTGGTKLTYADLGGAGWGTEASHRPTFAAPVAAFHSLSDVNPAASFPPAASAGLQGTEYSPLGGNWAAQQRIAASGGWPASFLPSEGIQRPQSADPARPRSSDPIRRHLEVPVDAGMAALGFMSDDANAVAAPSPGSLDGNAREFVPARRYGSCDAPGEQQSHDGGHLPRTLKVQRPCRYFLQGFCREGAKCKFAHRDPGSMTYSSAYISTAPAMSSPFSGLAASAQMPSATSLMDSAAVYSHGPMAPTAPVPQALADPVLSGTFSAESHSSASGFSFAAARPQDLAFPEGSLPSLLPISSGLGVSLPVGLSIASSANGPSTPTNGIAHERQLPYKQGPFPGVGQGVAGSSPFKFMEQQNRSGWRAAQQPF